MCHHMGSLDWASLAGQPGVHVWKDHLLSTSLFIDFTQYSTCFWMLTLLVQQTLQHVHLLGLLQWLGVTGVLKEETSVITIVWRIFRLSPGRSPWSSWTWSWRCLWGSCQWLPPQTETAWSVVWSAINVINIAESRQQLPTRDWHGSMWQTFQTRSSRVPVCASRPPGGRQSWSHDIPHGRSLAPEW